MFSKKAPQGTGTAPCCGTKYRLLHDCPEAGENMRLPYLFVVLIFIVATVFSGGASAQNPAPAPAAQNPAANPAPSQGPAPQAQSLAQNRQASVRISLDEAIQMALQHNHNLLAARSTIQQSQAEEITANLRP